MKKWFEWKERITGEWCKEIIGEINTISLLWAIEEVEYGFVHCYTFTIWKEKRDFSKSLRKFFNHYAPNIKVYKLSEYNEMRQ